MDAQKRQTTGDQDDCHGLSSAAECTAAVRLALATSAHRAARQIAHQGARLYPDDAELAKMARILAPPRVIRTVRADHTSTAANQAWLRQHFSDYQGMWVALCDGQLVAVAETLRDLQTSAPTFAGMMITRV